MNRNAVLLAHIIERKIFVNQHSLRHKTSSANESIIKVRSIGFDN